MPGLTPDPDRTLLDRLAAMERRLQALENRRTSERPHLLAYTPLYDTYSFAVWETLGFDNVSFDSHGILGSGGTIVTVPYTGRYVVGLELPARTSASAGNKAFFEVIDVDAPSPAEWSDVFTLPIQALVPVTLSFSWTAGDRKSIRVYANDAAISTDKSCALSIEFIRYEAP